MLLNAVSNWGRPTKWFKRGQADVIPLFGAPAYDIILPGKFASGDLTTEIQGNTLSQVDTPSYRQALTGAAGDPLGVGFDVGTTDSFDAADVTKYEVTTGAFSVLSSFKVLSATAGTSKTLLGKYYYGVTAGYLLFVDVSGSDAFLKAYWRGSGGLVTLNVATPCPKDTPVYAMLWRKSAAGGVGLTVSWGTEDVQADITANCANGSSLFSIGSAYYQAAASVVSPIVIWSGAAADTVIAARATTLPAWWALPA